MLGKTFDRAVSVLAFVYFEIEKYMNAKDISQKEPLRGYDLTWSYPDSNLSLEELQQQAAAAHQNSSVFYRSVPFGIRIDDIRYPDPELCLGLRNDYWDESFEQNAKVGIDLRDSSQAGPFSDLLDMYCGCRLN